MRPSFTTPPGAMSPTTARALRRGGLMRRGAAPPAPACDAAGKATVAAAAAAILASVLRSRLLERVREPQRVGTTARIGNPRIPPRARREVQVVRAERRILVEQVLDAGRDRPVRDAL